ncbi:choice-of-anchor J domain-containing protein [Prevotella sp. HUN102]|uniref:choice-of-anchor J domain-containing protein n=1 Tax=Prevotella sp. HUN102 TaxID=1392486 RepID=UPI000AD4BAF5|nr:choice-of-anchor J domain-containing protein [Prevotella sp. HUN102]
MKRITYFCACLIAVCSAMPALAQTKLEKQLAHKHEIQKRISKHQADRTVDYSLFNQMITKKNATMPASLPVLIPSVQKSPILTAVKAELWGSYVDEDYGKMVSFTPSATISFTTLKDELGFDTKFNGGSALIGNKYYGMKVSELAGFKMMDLYEYNTDTWELATDEPKMIFDKYLLATETAKDPASAKVFGQFFTEDMKALEWGFIDYAAQTRTAIKASTNRYVALGYGKDGFAYGVATDGNLYKIDTNNGSEALVGATGVTVMTANNQYYEQTGEIDPASGEFYWAATDANMVSRLYIVNLSTGAATEVGALPNAIVGMAIPAAEAAEGAPAKVTNVVYDFANGSLSGKVKFTAPTLTYGGNPLSATALTYTVYANDQKVAEGTVMPGANAEANVTVPKDGMYNFKIVAANAEGEGAKYLENQWIGHDEMAAPGNLTMTRSGNGNSHIKLTWTASTEALHNGYVGSVTYNVYRMQNGQLTKVSPKQTALTFEEDIPAGEFSNYYYIVQTVNGNVEGKNDNTEEFYFGKAYEPNYNETFDTEASSNPYIKINRVSGSYNPWEWDADKHYMKCSSSLKGKSDSWLISPPIHLKEGYTYFVKYDVTTPAGFEEKLEVKWGMEANDNENLLTKELMPVTTYTGKTNTVTSYEKEIVADADGNYNFGFHSVSEAGSFFVAVDNFRVEYGPLPTAPDSVTNLTGETEPSGLDQASITFTAPTKNRKGETITTLEKVVVMCGERTVATVSPVAPGQVCTVQDTEAEHGENTYAIYAYNENGVGQKSVITIKVGQDKPGPIANIASTDQLNSIKLSWDAPKAAEGGVLNPAGIWYTVYEVKSASEIEEIGQTEKGVTEFTIEDFKTYEGKQYIAYWAVTSKNASGSGDMRIKSMLVGKPYQMPHHRSFVDGSDEGLFMAAVPTENNESWTMLKGEASDGDNGCLYFNPAQAGSSMIMLGKVSLRGAVKPQLIFDYKCAPNAKRKMVIVAQPMNGSAQRLDIKDFSTITNAENWTRATIDIPKELTKVNYISFTILGEATAAQPENPIYVDNIHFVDPLPVDASVELMAPKTVNKGHKMSFKAKVTNLGKNTLDANTIVRISVNGNEIEQIALTKSLNTMNYELLPVSYQTSLNDAGTQLDVKAEVVAAGDIEKKNNVSEAAVKFAEANMPKPTNVTSTGNNQPLISLGKSHRLPLLP